MNSDDLVWIWLQFLGIKDPVPGKVPDPTGSGFTTLHPVYFVTIMFMFIFHDRGSKIFNI